MSKDVVGAVVPEGLVERLDKMRAWVLPGSPIEDVLAESADVLRKLPVRSGDADRINNPDFLAQSYSIETADEEKEVRLSMFTRHGQRGLLSYMVMGSSEAYELAHAILKAYDSVEGIK